MFKKRHPLEPPPGDDVLTALLSVDDILCQTDSESHEEVIRELLRRLVEHYEIGDPRRLLALVMEREATMPTVIRPGLAVPHARVEGLDRTHVAMATSRKGVRFQQESSRANLVVLVLVPRDQPAAYLRLLSVLGRVCDETEKISRIAELQTPGEVYGFFGRTDTALPRFIKAADIMEPDPPVLQETDSLKDAIDLFVQLNLVDAPVVDKDGDLVGVVTANALLKICLPEYLLWIEDLSPIQNFEPFVTVLRNEKNTWLADIMEREYATVQSGQPAIAVAEELLRRHVSRCYVLDNRRLTGVIPLQLFLNKVLRE